MFFSDGRDADCESHIGHGGRMKPLIKPALCGTTNCCWCFIPVFPGLMNLKIPESTVSGNAMRCLMQEGKCILLCKYVLMDVLCVPSSAWL